jgi:hypothetical protein
MWLEMQELNNGIKLRAYKKQAKQHALNVRKHIINREGHIETFLMGKKNNVNSLTKAANSLNKAKQSKALSDKAARDASKLATKIHAVWASRMAAKALSYSKLAKNQLNRAFNLYPNVIVRKGRFIMVN